MKVLYKHKAGLAIYHSTERTCKQCVAYEQGWKEATLIKAIECGITLPKLVHCMARLVAMRVENGCGQASVHPLPDQSKFASSTTVWLEARER